MPKLCILTVDGYMCLCFTGDLDQLMERKRKEKEPLDEMVCNNVGRQAVEHDFLSFVTGLQQRF